MPELIWEGKYDDNGQIVGPPRVSLPFQTVETVNQSAQERQLALTANNSGSDPAWRNRLIWGDKKYVLPSLLDDFAGKIDLIYIDPPFATGADFSYQTQVHPNEGTNKSSVNIGYEPNLIEQIAYRDTWGGGLDTYLRWIHETMVLLRELLAEAGSIYVHCDWHTSHYVKPSLDAIFGQDRFLNEVVWHYKSFHGNVRRYFARKHDSILVFGQDRFLNEVVWHYKSFHGNVRRYFARKHDSILVYTKSSAWVFNRQFDDNNEDTIDYSRWNDYLVDGSKILGNNMPMQDSRFVRFYNRWVREQGRKPEPGDIVYEVKGQSLDSVWDVKPVDPKDREERIGYPTQKPEALLRRIIGASSNPGDLVLDCFVGSGTTAAVAEKLGRRWIAADMGRFAIATTRKRLDIPRLYVQNLGRYERQAWQSAELEQDYRVFILQLYRAEPVSGYQWLHGAKAGRMVHVGAVDAPVVMDDVHRVVGEFREAMGSGVSAPTSAGVDILGWDFGLEVDTEARQLGRDTGVNVRPLRIPREVMDQKAVNAGDVRFFELAALAVDQKVNRRQRSVTLTLQDFTMPMDAVPDKVRDAVTHWSQWIDYWAVDWDFRDDTFNNQWQSYRTRQEPQLQRSIAHSYEQRGTYTVVVKVIDILGNDTTRRLEVTV